MSKITDARDAYLAARRRVTETRLALGRAISEARAAGTEQGEIARKLGLTREQVRRYQDEYERDAGLKKTKPKRDAS